VHPDRAIEPSSPGSPIEQSCTLPKAIAETMYTGYRRSRTLLRQITSRPGVQVLLNTETEAIAKASGPELAAKFRLRALKRFKSQYGPGHIVGARGKQLWYVLESTDSEETGAWYWQQVELEELINSGFVSFENLLDGATSTDAARTSTPRSPVVPTPPMPLSEFSACAFPSAYSDSSSGAVPWSLSEDVSLCEAINTFADKQGVDPMLLSSDQLETFRCRMAILPSRGRAEIHARYAALCVLNRAAELVLPLSDLGVQVGSNLLTDTKYEFEMRRRLNLPELTGPSQSLLDIKKVIFFRTKQHFWDLVLKKTTSATAEPPDEWDKPPDLREIRLNRLVARSLMSRKDSYPFAERLKRSVFGQLIEVLGG
ncbi:hypothetical protein EBZ37_14400, partial [bacterium]|nr:hypothetical protein [bacterium]